MTTLEMDPSSSSFLRTKWQNQRSKRRAIRYERREPSCIKKGIFRKVNQLASQRENLVANKPFPAAEKYEEASNLDTTDPAPLRALSSALFELGRYEDSISVIQKALALEKEEEKRKQLLVREGKCRFYLRDWAVLVKKLEGMELSQEEKKLVEASEGYKKNGDESESAWKEIVELPRTRPKAGEIVLSMSWELL